MKFDVVTPTKDFASRTRKRIFRTELKRVANKIPVSRFLAIDTGLKMKQLVY